MIDKIQSSKIVQSITKLMKPCLYILMVASVCAVINHYFMKTNGMFLLASYTLTKYMPYIVGGLFVYFLTDNLALGIASVLLIRGSFTYAFIVPILVYLVYLCWKKCFDTHLLKDVPKFVEDSVKDVLLILTLIFIYFIPLPKSLPILKVIFDSIYFIILVLFLNCYVFYKGYHPSLLHGVIGPLEIVFLTENIMNYISGLPMEHMLTHGVMSAMGNCSGTGITIGIVLLASKYFPKGTGINAFFGVNEPVIFGLPIVNNKKAFVPFVIGGTLLGSIPMILMYLGYLNKPIFDAPYLGIGLEGLLVNMDIRSLAVAIIQVILSVLIWYPFYVKEMKKDEI